ncbi:MAG: septal ring lytic transglycosylase RlpA family protein [bacterium]
MNPKRFITSHWIGFLILMIVAIQTTGCVTARKHSSRKETYIGMASWYGKKYHRKTTASGEKYNMRKLTAAHPFLPFGTKVKVTHLENGKSVIVTINDRGPFKKDRIIDLSYKAAQKIGMVKEGVARVKLEIIK